MKQRFNKFIYDHKRLNAIIFGLTGWGVFAKDRYKSQMLGVYEIQLIVGNEYFWEKRDEIKDDIQK